MRPDAADLKKTDPIIPEYKDPPELADSLGRRPHITRYEEAFLTLIQDVSRILGGDWDNSPQIEVKEEFSRAIHRALKIWI